MSKETVGTIGNEKKTNYALRADMTEAEFVKELTEGILPPPQYFPKNANTTENKTLALPQNLMTNIKLNCNAVRYQNHLFTHVQAQLKLRPSYLKISNIKLTHAQGTINGTLILKAGRQLELETDFKLNKINITELLKGWDSFGAPVHYKNVQGTLSAALRGVFPLNKDLSIQWNKAKANIPFHLYQGALNNLDVMREMRDYMRKNRMAKVALGKHLDPFTNRFNTITFEEIHNEIELKNGRFIVPQMHVKNTVLDFNLSGYHALNNQMDYHFSFYLRDLKTVDNQTEFGIVNDDGLGINIYVHAYGQTNNMKFSLDSKAKKAQKKELRKQEKQNLKSMLKSELGLFKNDTTVRHHQTKKEEVIISFEDEDAIDKLKTKEKKKKGKVGKLLNKWKNEAKKKDQKEIDL